MKNALLVVIGKIQICAYLCMFSVVVAAQGTGVIVESPAFTPGQASRQGAAMPAAGNNDAMSLLLEQIQQLQTEVQALRGFIEEQGFELRKLQRDSLARYTNMDDRLSALESGAARGTATLTPSPAIPTTGLPNTAIPNTTVTNTTVPNTTPGASPGTQSDATPVASTGAGLSTSLPAATNRPIVSGTPAVAINTPGSLTPAAPAPVTTISTTNNPAVTAPTASTTAQPEPLVAATNASTDVTANVATPNSVPARNSGRGTLQPAILSEQQLYQMAYDSVINSNFERSIAEFDQYLGNYPQGRFITNAHYWKGQAYLYLNRYDEARAAYEIIINQFADSPKLPDALYGLGLAHQGLGNIDQARRLLNDIKRRFPNTGVANLADTRLLSLD